MAGKRIVWFGANEMVAVTERANECDEDSVAEEPTDDELVRLAKWLRGEQPSVLRKLQQEAYVDLEDRVDRLVVNVCEDGEEATGGSECRGENESQEGDVKEECDEEDGVMEGLDAAKSLVKGMADHPAPEMRRLRKIVIRTRRRYREMRREWRAGLSGMERRSSSESVETVREFGARDDGEGVSEGLERVREVDEELREGEEEGQRVSAQSIPKSAFGAFKLYGVRKGIAMREVAEALRKAVPESRRLNEEEFVGQVRRLNVKVSGGDAWRENIVISVPFFVLEGLLGRQEHLEIDRERLEIERFWEAPQCLNCWGYRHTSRECIRETRCKNCAGFHHHRHCRDTKRRCVNCVESGAVVEDTGHSAGGCKLPRFHGGIGAGSVGVAAIAGVGASVRRQLEK